MGESLDLNVNLTLSEGERERKLGTGFLDCPVAGGRVDKAVGSPRPQLLCLKAVTKGGRASHYGLSSLGQIDTELRPQPVGPGTPSND